MRFKPFSSLGDLVLLALLTGGSLFLIALPLVAGGALCRRGQSTGAIVVGLASLGALVLAWLLIPAILFGLSGA